MEAQAAGEDSDQWRWFGWHRVGWCVTKCHRGGIVRPGWYVQ